MAKLNKVLTADEVERLQEIKNQFRELLDEAKQIVRGTSEADRAQGYWVAHIAGALDGDHEFLGGSMITMEQTIDSLAEQHATVAEEIE